jgi:hypothetical protein
MKVSHATKSFLDSPRRNSKETQSGTTCAFSPNFSSPLDATQHYLGVVTDIEAMRCFENLHG